jgi:hypothetical protein
MPTLNSNPTDLSAGYKNISTQISAFQAYTAVSSASKDVDNTQGNSDAQSVGSIATGLNQISKEQKRFQRNTPTSYNELINLIGKSSGNGSATTKELRKILLQTALKMEPYVNQIVKEQALKLLGCSQQQTYQGINQYQINLYPNLATSPPQNGVYVKIEDIDFNKSLTVKPTSLVGKALYDSTSLKPLTVYKNYKGPKPFPMNYELWSRTQSPKQTFKDEFEVFYNGGGTKQRIFDISYVNQDSLGNSGDFFRVFLLNREDAPTGNTANKLAYSAQTVSKSLSDYYQSIKVFEAKTFAGTLLNILVGTLSSGLSITQIEKQTKLALIINRIFGRCESGQNEIDVSGVAKVSEVDVDDNEFFDFDQIDLKNIDTITNNFKQNVIEYEDCGNIKFPVDNNSLLTQLGNLNDVIDDLSIEEQVQEIENILDSIPNTINQTTQSIGFDNPFNQDVLKKIPTALAYTVLNPKVLLPIFTFKQVLENQVLGFSNQLINSGGTIINVVNRLVQSANTINQLANPIINDGVEFARKLRQFIFGLVGAIAEKFLETLFEVLKKNLLNLIRVILNDIAKTTKDVRIRKIQALLDAGEFLVTAYVTARNYRECKNLIGQIQKILKLISRQIPNTNPLSKSLVGLANYLPGTSPERATINAIEIAQKFGLPTGALADGQPNKMIFYQLATQRGMKFEDASNGVVDIGVDPITGLPVGKNR